MIRFGSVYSRLHAATKSATLGVAGVLIGTLVFFYFQSETIDGSLILGIVFVLLTSPISGHLISRAAYRSGVPLWDPNFHDELKQHTEIGMGVKLLSETEKEEE